jgi:protocatechuate 3,4-dioxygenase, beta subunit
MSNDVSTLNRRRFLQRASVAAFALPMVGIGSLELTGCVSDKLFAHARVDGKHYSAISWKTVIVSNEEPGDPLIISGTIYAPDGRTPMEGINLWVYHTDATGNYSPLSQSGGDNRNTRLHGLMQTDSKGRYEFRTIKPAPYPGHTNPAHIHAYLSGPGYPEYWIESYLFEGDRFIGDEMRQKLGGQGTFSAILKLTRDSDGVLRGVRDIKLERCSSRCTHS